MRRLAQAGFKKAFVDAAILPDWWDDNCAADPGLLQDVEIRVARFLGLPLEAVASSEFSLNISDYQRAQLRRIRDIDRDRLRPAIHAAVRIAGAVVRSLRKVPPEAPQLPPDGLVWRSQIEPSGKAPSLSAIVSDLWERGIPVVPADLLPAPSFQGLACIVENRPVILIGHKHEEPGRLAFLVAHEAAHIAANDCAPGRPVVDQEEEIADNTNLEVRADQYATRVLLGRDSAPELKDGDFKSIARQAAQIERSEGSDASSVIFAWARRSGDYAAAANAVKALYRNLGGRRQLRVLFDRFVDVENASESDRALLRCVYDSPKLDEAGH